MDRPNVRADQSFPLALLVGSPAARQIRPDSDRCIRGIHRLNFLTTNLLNDKDLSRILQTPTIRDITTQLLTPEARYFFFLFEKTEI